MVSISVFWLTWKGEFSIQKASPLQRDGVILFVSCNLYYSICAALKCFKTYASVARGFLYIWKITAKNIIIKISNALFVLLYD